MKLFSLLLPFGMLSLSYAQAQITVTVEGQEITKGSTIDSYKVEKNEFTFNGETFNQFQLMPEVLVTSAIRANYEISVTNNSTEEIFSSDGYPILPQFCWPTTCKAIKPGETVVQTGELKAHIPTDLYFDSGSFSNHEGSFFIPCSIEITQTDNPDNTFSFDINMIFDPDHEAGIEKTIEEVNEAIYYDLQGRLVSQPSKGIYLRKNGKKTTKIIF